MKPLFGYGTFRKAAWCSAILGAAYPAQPATLSGYRRVATGSGYLSLRETVVDLAPVEGVLIELDAIGWTVADAWEGVPTYQRIEVTVNTMHGPREAVAYMRPGASGPPVEGDVPALLLDRDVEQAIAEFVPIMRALRGEG